MIPHYVHICTLYMCVRVYVCMYTCVHACTCVCIPVCVCVRVYVYLTAFIRKVNERVSVHYPSVVCQYILSPAALNVCPLQVLPSSQHCEVAIYPPEVAKVKEHEGGIEKRIEGEMIRTWLLTTYTYTCSCIYCVYICSKQQVCMSVSCMLHTYMYLKYYTSNIIHVHTCSCSVHAVLQLLYTCTIPTN